MSLQLAIIHSLSTMAIILQTDGITGGLGRAVRDAGATIFDWAVGIASDSFQSAIQGMVSLLDELITQTPYPRTADGDPNLFASPAGTDWTRYYELFGESAQPYGYILLIMASLVIVFISIFQTLELGTYDEEKAKKRVIVGFIAVTLWWPLATFNLAFTDALATLFLNFGGSGGLERTPELVNEAVGSGGGGLTLNIVMLVVYVLQFPVLLVLTAIWAVRLFLIYIVTAIMPIFIALWALQFPGFNKLGEMSEKIFEWYLIFVYVAIPGALIIGFTNLMLETQLVSSGETVASIDSVEPRAESVPTIIQPESDNIVSSLDGQSVMYSLPESTGVFSNLQLVIAIVLGFALPILAGFGPFVLVYGYKKTLNMMGGAVKSGAALTAGVATGGAGLAAGLGASGLSSTLGSVSETLRSKEQRDAISSNLKSGVRNRFDRKRNKFNSWREEASVPQKALDIGKEGIGFAGSAVKSPFTVAGAALSLTRMHRRGGGLFNTPTGYGMQYGVNEDDVLENAEEALDNAKESGDEAKAQKLESFINDIEGGTLDNSELLKMAITGDILDRYQTEGSSPSGAGASGDGGEGASSGQTTPGGSSGDSTAASIQEILQSSSLFNKNEYLSHLGIEQELLSGVQDPWQHRTPESNLTGPLGSRLAQLDSWMKGETTRYDKNKVRGEMVGNFLSDKFNFDIHPNIDVDIGENERRQQINQGDLINPQSVAVDIELDPESLAEAAESFASSTKKKLRSEKLLYGIEGEIQKSIEGGIRNTTKTYEPIPAGSRRAQYATIATHPDQGGAPEALKYVIESMDDGKELQVNDIDRVSRMHGDSEFKTRYEALLNK